MHLLLIVASLFSWFWPNHDNSNGAMFGADLGHTCVYDCDPLPHTPTLKWQQKLNAFQEQPPVATEQLVFCPTVAGTLYACDRETGAVQWKSQLEGRFATSLAVVEATDTLFIGATNGCVYAFDCKAGTIKWQQGLGTIVSSPVVNEGILYFGSEEGDVWAVEAATGESRWARRLGGPIEGAVTIDIEADLLYASASGTLHALEIEKGSAKWSKSLGKMCCTCPVLHEGRIYITNDKNELLALDASDGTLVWKLKGQDAFATPAVTGHTLFWPTTSGVYSAIDLASGKVKWNFKTNARVCREVAIAGNALYLMTQKGMVYALNSDTGKELWRYPFKGTGQAGPTLCRRELFFTDEKGNLYALR